MEILKGPVLTEKASQLTEKQNRYVFKVDHRANKLQIKKAIEKMYNVHIEGINTMIVAGKRKSRHTKAGLITGKTPKYKKAIVELKEGQSIDFYSNI